MDPETTLAMILEFMADGDHDSALESGNNLATWMESGGFLPAEFVSIVDDITSARDDAFPTGGFSRREFYDDSATIEFRIYLRPEGTLELSIGDPSYDTDHRGACGAGSVSATDSAADIRAAVISAFDDSLEFLAQTL